MPFYGLSTSAELLPKKEPLSEYEKLAFAEKIKTKKKNIQTKILLFIGKNSFIGWTIVLTLLTVLFFVLALAMRFRAH